MGKGIDSIDEFCLGQCPSNTAQTCCDGGTGDILRDSQDIVDDMDDAASEVLILFKSI